jgi:O-antigen/teichoic acid export membrane protein
VSSGAVGDDILATSAAGPAAARGGMVRVAGFGLGAAVSVLSASLLFRHLGVEGSGQFATVVALVTIFAGVTEAGLWGVAVREFAARPEHDTDANTMKHIAGLRLVLSTAAGLAATAFALIAGYDDDLVVGTVIFAFASVLQSLQVTWTAPLAARLRYGWITGLDLLKQVASVGGIVVLATTGASLLAFLVLTVPVALIALIPTAWIVRHLIPLTVGCDRIVWARLLRTVLPYAAATAIAAMYFRVTLIIVNLVAGETQTGYYSVSFRVIEVLVVVPGLIAASVFPIFARAAGEDLVRLRFGVQRVLDVLCVAGAAVSLGLFVGAPAVITVLAGPQFDPAGAVLRVQSIGLFGAFVSAVFGFVLLSLRKHSLMLKMSFAALTINVGMTLALAPGDGAMGGAIATATSEVALAVVGFVVVRRLLPGGLSLRAPIGAAVLAAGCSLLALVDGEVGASVLSIVAVVLYLVLTWTFRLVPPGLVADLRGGPSEGRA